MLFHRVREVEFVGGPFDGHRQTIRLSKEDCQQAIVIPVNENAYRRLAGLSPVPNAGASSYAVYELRKRDREYCYYFTVSKPPSEFEKESQRV
ncbi:MAG: hypothetical protein H6822_02620 [Planctomycetaceae bacterium]|nr:hypothetical protein [Planctomycetales bacterium]MCB9921045.1 hypothetical protein [Planctomycetaceae bacterium]